MQGELQPVGPAWDWLLQRPQDRCYARWSREPLREEVRTGVRKVSGGL